MRQVNVVFRSDDTHIVSMPGAINDTIMYAGSRVFDRAISVSNMHVLSINIKINNYVNYSDCFLLPQDNKPVS